VHARNALVSALLVLLVGCGGEAPLGLEVRINPSLAEETDDLQAEVATPPANDDGNVTYSYAWFRDGALVADYVDAVLPASATAPEEVWRVVVIPTMRGVAGEVGVATVVIRATDNSVDADGDGHPRPPEGLDCDDEDPEVHPGADEVCDGKDNNCDQLLDEGYDVDDDGVTTCGGDCDDDDPDVSPDVSEECDGADNNCDGLVDEGFVDADGDGVPGCLDCDDDDASNFPGNPEICDLADNNCDDQVDELFADDDGDTYVCNDCNESAATVYPGAPPVCDEHLDNDCDGATDPNEADVDGDGDSPCDGDCAPADPAQNVNDGDGDGVTTCSAPPDCDDGDASNFPGNTEACDGVDNDCDGVPESTADLDGDGVTTCLGDCDDTNAAIAPGLAESCDGLDNDCNGTVDDGFADADGDGSASCVDCDDTEAAALPGGVEVCDAIDNDCNSLVDEGFDTDGDGVTTCGPDGQPGTADDDCNDSSGAVYPGASDQCDGIIDHDCDGTPDPLQADDDGDGLSECAGDCDDTDGAINPNDADGDGYDSCTGGDCDDTDAAISPAGTELCNAVDDDCDGDLDNGFDTDDDGYLDGDNTDCAAAWPSGSLDCDDADPDVFPGAADVCDGVPDNDCDNSPDPLEYDDDGDGTSDCDGDCDDTDPTIGPSAFDDPTNGIDDDCDGTIDEPPPPRWAADLTGSPILALRSWDYSAGDLGTSYTLSSPTGANLEAAVVADFDGDGNEDLVAQSDGSNPQVFYFQGDASGSFTYASSPGFQLAGIGAQIWTAGDIDNDGTPDIIGWDYADGEGWVWLTGSSGGVPSWTRMPSSTFGIRPFELQYWDPSAFNYQDHESVHLPLVDVDLDGNLDIVECANSSSSPSECAVHSGDGTGNFALTYTFQLGRLINGFAIADFDGDGALDMLGGFDDDGDAGQSWIWTGGLANWNGGGTAAFDLNPNSGTNASNAVGYGWPYPFDADQDGDPDLIVKIIEPFNSNNRMLYFVENVGGTWSWWTLAQSWSQHSGTASMVQDAIAVSP